MRKEKRFDANAKLASAQNEEEGKLASQVSARSGPPLARGAVQRKSAESLEAGVQQRKKDLKEQKREQVQRRHQLVVQRKAMGADGGVAPADVEQRLSERGGKGSPLPEGVRHTMEEHVGVDLSRARVHTDGEAAHLASELGAHAFTVGNDVYFNQGQYQPETPAGSHLLAHELTHVAQQGAAAEVIQRDNDGATPVAGSGAAPSTPAPSGNPNRYEGEEGIADKTQPRVRLDLRGVRLPTVKQPFTPAPVRVRPSGERRSDTQAQVWDGAARGGQGLNASLDTKIASAWQYSAAGGNPIYYLRIGRRESYLVGTRTELRDRVLRPYWTPEGELVPFQVDHKLEYQLNGADRDINNLWLLDMHANTSSGSLINAEVERRTTLLLAAAAPTLWPSGQPDYDAARANYEIWIPDPVFNVPTAGGRPRSYTLAQIADEAIHMGPVTPMSPRDVQRARLEPNPARFVVYNNARGGRSHVFDLPAGAGGGAVPFSDPSFIPGFTPTAINLTPGQAPLAQVTGTLLSGDNPNLEWHGRPCTVDIAPMQSVPNAGHVDFSSLRRKVQEFLAEGGVTLKALSPIQFVDMTLEDNGLAIYGRVLPSIPLLERADIRVVITPGEVRLQKTFSGGEVSLPGPFHITGSSLTIALGSRRGLSVDGQVRFAIERVGNGYIGATASTGTGSGSEFAAEGRFNFEPGLFDDPSYVAVRYRNGRFAGEGQLSIASGRIRGVRSGTLQASFDGADFSVRGSVEPAIPGIQQASVGVRRTDAEGLIYDGDLTLAPSAAIRSGSIHATLAKREGGWKVTATGTAQPNVSGVESALNVSYDDGAFSAEVTVGYRRGRLDGSLTVGVTNADLGDDGRPRGPATDASELRIFGGGSLTLTITPWLQGTAGVRILPNGEIEVHGRLAVPQPVTMFDARRWDRTLLSIGLDIPIFGVAVAGQRIGIFCTIGGDLKLVAGIGPAQINNIALDVTYNAAHEDQTHVVGTAGFHMPADAGLELGVHAAIGAGIPIVSAQAGINLSGKLGVETALDVPLTVDWTPATGLTIDAPVSISMQPVFTFRVNGYVLVEADLLLTSIELYRKDWNLASLAIGSGYQVGMSMPFHYAEGQPFNPSLSDIQLTYPSIEPMQILTSIFDRIT